MEKIIEYAGVASTAENLGLRFAGVVSTAENMQLQFVGFGVDDAEEGSFLLSVN